MPLLTTLFTILILVAFHYTEATTSPIPPFTTYKYSTELQHNVADLWWNVNETSQEIVFELHVNTTGWIALGISPAGGMKGADIGLGWIDQTGQLHFEDRYAYDFVRPVMDNTTIDWFGLQGRQMDGWTAIQFTRALVTCDTMDVPIKSGTDIVIFAYGLEIPDTSVPEGLIYYHESRRGTRIIPLRSYAIPPPEDKFAGLDYVDFKLNNYTIPANDTTYYCKIHRVPKNITTTRHAIAYNTMIEPGNIDIVHHMLMYECDPTAVFDDDNLPEGLCDDLYLIFNPCSSNLATAWAVGGDFVVEYPEIAGYPMGGNSEVKYYMIQMHYNNPKLTANRRDSTGLRFYLGDKLREQELGYLTFGTNSYYGALSIPGRADKFIVDSYCSASASNRIPQSGITVFSAFPHTHLQGRSIWTKIIRNGTAVEYLFNDEAYDFNYQFQNALSSPIQLYPGDEFATRCTYSTTNKNETTLGGERTRDEMCFHIFTYYPRMKNLYACIMALSNKAWREMLNKTDPTVNMTMLPQWLMERQWTPERIEEWQTFYNDASRLLIYGHSSNMSVDFVPHLPAYEDLKPSPCKKGIPVRGSRRNSWIFSV